MRNSTLVRNIKSTLEDQPTAVKVVTYLVLIGIVLACIALIAGLLAGATAAVFLTVPLAAPKTRRDYFDELPEPYRTQAYENTRASWAADGHKPETIERVITLPCPGLEDALKGAFVYRETPQGHLYWSRAANGIFDAPEDTSEPIRSKIERILWIALFILLLFGFFYMVGHTVEMVLSLAAVPLTTPSRMQKAITTRDKLQKAIDAINRRIDQGKNIDDQLSYLVELDKKTKGLSFKPLWDSYEIITDVEKLAWAFEAHGPEGYKEFKTRLIEKGGPDYAHRTINELPDHLRAEIFKLKI